MKPKFRVWGNIGKEFIDYCDVRMELTTGRIYAGDMNYPGAMIDITDGVVLMQSTGLKDTNGVEIYEGDVLRDSESIVIVKFVDGEFSVDYRTMGGKWRNYGSLFDYLEDYEGEIIGNIYENPELMEVAE